MSSFLLRLKLLLELRNQQEFFRTFKRKKLLLIGGIILIVAWQGLNALNYKKIDSSQGRKLVSGLRHNWGQNFLYFYYYLGYFPLVSTEDARVFSKEGAQELIDKHPQKLVMEVGHWARSGENGRIWAYMPQAWLFQSAQKPGVRPFNIFFFCLTLCALYFSFWKHDLVLLGSFIVLFTGSCTHFLFDVYFTDNIHGILFFNSGLLLAINLHLILGKYFRLSWMAPIVSGLLLGFFSSIRAEVLPMMAGCIGVYLLLSHLNFLKKIIYVVFILVSFYTFKTCAYRYFDFKIKEAQELCIKKGGHAYTYSRMKTHSFWHPVFVFLSDYDTEKGYGPFASDTVAYNYATPILNKKYGYHLSYSADYWLNEYYDADSLYYKKLEEIPEYDLILKQKILNDIKNDPFWFATIILKRINAVMACTSPVAISFAGRSFIIPFLNGYLLLPILLLVFFVKNYNWVRLILFILPLSATPIFLFAKGNSTYDAIFHLITLSIGCSLVFEIWKFSKAKQLR